ncbi:MAG TPA: glycosyltransferase family 1 protein [Marinobacter sp.]|uniref:Glycosyltransferase family 1 protein n=1 Tax=marine sediment metagenome TaxID=412755 RepID=A0A0F9UTZ1_9ZZZZ|nr:glycosyltransferase family 1 protein [Marinobacter sp.]
MIKSIAVPRKNNQRYYDTHYRFFFEMIKAVGVNLRYYDDMCNDSGFGIWLAHKHVLIDYGDHMRLPLDLSEFDIAFKYHYSKKYHSDIPRLYPLTPISFYNWKKYQELEKTICYGGNAEFILNNQRPGATAKQRRNTVQRKLKERYGTQVDTNITSQESFWRKINNCLVSVCVPGARNNILDRGQLQYMAFGACTISPPLDIMLPFRRQPQAGIHYLTCRPDYSDLIEVIEYCRENRDRCRMIGQQAKKLFLSTSTPDNIWKWINQCIGLAE